MQTHQRPYADRVDRRTTIFRCRSVIAAALILPLLAAGCGSNRTADTALPTPPVSQRGDDIVSETVGALDAIAIPDDGVAATDDTGVDGDDVPDYTDAELDVLLNTPPADEDGLNPPETEPLEADSPAAAIEAIAAALDDSPRAAVEGTPILDKVEPFDSAPTPAAFGIRDGRRINEVGEAIRLDEPAAVACANVEIALTTLDENQPADAADHLRAASTTAAGSTVAAMNPWASILEQLAADIDGAETTNDEISALLAFLTTCTQGGYEL